MRKDDVTLRYDYGQTGRPAVNVKVYDTALPADAFAEIGDPRFTPEWIADHLTDEERDAYWVAACESGWEDLQSDAEDIWNGHNGGRAVKVYSEGRSGGWAVVEGLPAFDTWDAIDLGRWARFARTARAIADGTAYTFVTLVGFNAFDAWAADLEEQHRTVEKWSEVATLRPTAGAA